VLREGKRGELFKGPACVHTMPSFRETKSRQGGRAEVEISSKKQEEDGKGWKFGRERRNRAYLAPSQKNLNSTQSVKVEAGRR